MDNNKSTFDVQDITFNYNASEVVIIVCDDTEDGDVEYAVRCGWSHRCEVIEDVEAVSRNGKELTMWPAGIEKYVNSQRVNRMLETAYSVWRDEVDHS